jgi:hypothetical protein
MPTIGNKIPNNHEHNADPNPNIKIEIADNIPLCFDAGNQRSIFLFGVIYPHPSAIPHITPQPIYINKIDFNVHANPPISNPIINNDAETIDAIFICLSTSGPNNAAPIPRKNIFKQNVN